MIEGAAEGGKGGESLRYTRTCKRSPLSQAPLWVIFALWDLFAFGFSLSASDHDGVFRADVGACAAGDTLVLVQLPDLLLAIYRQGLARALAGTDGAVDALARVLGRLAVASRFDSRCRGRCLRCPCVRFRCGGRRVSLLLRCGGSRCRGGRLGRGLLHGLLDEGAGDDQVSLLNADHVVILCKLDGVAGAEIGAGAAGTAVLALAKQYSSTLATILKKVPMVSFIVAGLAAGLAFITGKATT